MIFVFAENYLELFVDSRFIESIFITLVFVMVTVLFGALISLGIALIANEKIRGVSILRMLILIPWAIPPVVIGTMWAWIFNANFGVLNSILFQIGFIDKYIIWLEGIKAFLAVFCATLWSSLPLNILIFLSSLVSIPNIIYEAAILDGTNSWQRFRYITLPHLKKALFFVVVLQSIFSIKLFDIIYIMTPDQRYTRFLTFLAYKEGYRYLHFGYSSAIAWIVVIISIILFTIYLRLLKMQEEVK